MGGAAGLLSRESFLKVSCRGLVQIVVHLIRDFLIGSLAISKYAKTSGDLAPERHGLALGLEEAGDRRGPAVPIRRLHFQLFSPGAGEPVEFGSPRVVGFAPLGSEPAHALQALKRGEERAGV